MSTHRTAGSSSDGATSAAGRAARSVFATTHWSIVVGAQACGTPAAERALETLCGAYWYPLYAHARRLGHRPADAEDLTQGFFARLLAKNYLRAAAREKGKFRTFLLTAFTRYRANEWDRQHAGKRGGFTTVVSIDQGDAEARWAAEPSPHLPPDRLFDRQWAVVVLDTTLARLRAEYAATGRTALFAVLQACVTPAGAVRPYAELAAELGLTPDAVKMAVHRLRTRYRAVLRAVIAETVASPEQVEEELRDLFAAFGP